VTSSTAYTEAGRSTTASSVTAGLQIVAVGTLDTDQTDLDASSVQIVLPEAEGAVTAVSGTTITITERSPGSSSGTSVQLSTDSSTTFTVQGTTPGASTAGSLSSVKVGDQILAQGTPGSSATFAALSVTVLDRSAGTGHFGRHGGPAGGSGGGGFGGPGGGGSAAPAPG
jgi:hypothetical protein